MNEQLNDDMVFKRIQRVRSADWLSLKDLCFHCGYTDTIMRELVKRNDFPTPSAPTDTVRGRRWSKQEVNEWLIAHKLDAVSDI